MRVVRRNRKEERRGNPPVRERRFKAVTFWLRPTSWRKGADGEIRGEGTTWGERGGYWGRRGGAALVLVL